MYFKFLIANIASDYGNEDPFDDVIDKIIYKRNIGLVLDS